MIRQRPLEPGDRLSRDEFEQRYDAMSNVKKAELIDGVVHSCARRRTPFTCRGGW